MKKLFILIAAILFGISASFAQGVYLVNVSWDPEECFGGTCGDDAADYFKISITIYDDANSEYVVQNKIATAVIGATDKDVDVDEVETWCKDSHDYTPSFTVYATVWLMDTDTNPPSSCCTGSDDYSSFSCHDFHNAIVVLTPEIELN